MDFRCTHKTEPMPDTAPVAKKLRLYAMTLGENKTLLFCQRNRAVKRLLIHSALLRLISNASSYSSAELTRRPTNEQCTGGNRPWTLRSKWDVFIKPLPSGIREPWRKGGGKTVETRDDG